MNEYCVVFSTKEKDHQEKGVKAKSLNEAMGKVRQKYAQKIKNSKSTMVYLKVNHRGFDKNSRLIFPSGDVKIMIGSF